MTVSPLDLQTVHRLRSPLTFDSFERVVAELVQNSLDSGAKTIDIRIDFARFTIVVEDDGKGICGHDLAHVGKKNYTSKLECLEQLENLGTFGFRGESLHHLSGLSKVAVLSKVSDLSLVYKKVEGKEPFVYEFDNILNPKSHNAFYLLPIVTSGTTVLVQDLFYNLAVRQTMINNTDSLKIIDGIRRELVAFEGVNISLRISHQGMLSLAVVIRSHHNLLNQIFGLNLKYKIVNANYKELHLTGYIGTVSSYNNCQFVLYNNRFIHLDIKRFTSVFPKRQYPIFRFAITGPTVSSELFQDPTKKIWTSKYEDDIYRLLDAVFSEYIPDDTMTPKRKKKPITTFKSPIKTPKSPISPKVTKSPISPLKHTKTLKLSKLDFDKYRIISQIDTKFILVLANQKLVAIDQHACDERIRVEDIQKEFITNSDIVPTKIRQKVDSYQLQLFIRYEAMVLQLGIGITVDGFDIIVTQMPQILTQQHDIVSKIAEYLHQIGTEGTGLKFSHSHWFKSINNIPEFITDIINSKACRSAIMFGDKLSISEMEYLVQKLLQCQLPFQCPHGRPSVVPVVDDINRVSVLQQLIMLRISETEK